MFKPLKEAIQRRYETLSKGQSVAFYKDIDRELIWNAYLEGFPEHERQEHNCNACRSFLRQFGGLVFINKEYIAESIWSINLQGIDEHYHQAIKNVRRYVDGLPITNAFYASERTLGVPQNRDRVRSLIWEHFSLQIDSAFMHNAAGIDSLRGTVRTKKETYQRAIESLTFDAIDSILELIAQGTLYRGNEQLNAVKALKTAKTLYQNVQPHLKDNYCWIKSASDPITASIRNSAIGTLLIDLSEDVDLDVAVRKWESVMAPANYKRPTALVTPKMIENAKQTMSDLGLLESLGRRYAKPTDITINNVLFTDRSSEVRDVFDELAKGTLVNPKKLSKVEEISMEDFINNVVPTAKSIEVLLENRHFSNLVSIVTAEDPNANLMFKWNNPFSWSYTGGVTDSIKERVKQAGGNVDGVLRFSIQWNDEDTKCILDFDAHAYEPGGTHIYYASSYRGSARTPMSGNLDIDMTGSTSKPGTDFYPTQIENITWSDLSKMKDGVYQLKIHNYSQRPNKGFKAQIEFAGETHNFFYAKSAMGTIDVANVTLKNGIFTIQPKLDGTSDVASTIKWGVNSNQYTKVKNIMLSPNHWDDQQIGNKHYIFALEGCVSDEQARPFYNEFLKNELNEHRKVFEILAGKMLVADSDVQVSGVGFSDTQDNSINVRVTGAIKRNLKIKIKNG